MRQILAHGATTVHSVGVAGRPPVSSRAAIERVAFALFARHGFDETTVDEIAAAAGISRRTFFRYFATKNDVVWGEFDRGLERFREVLAGSDPGEPWTTALRGGVVDFNALPAQDVALHRERMELILHVPALQAYATLMYARWRGVVSEFVAERTGCKQDDLLPRLVGHTALAAAVAAYEQWLAEPSASLEELLDAAMQWLAGRGLAGEDRARG
jgi:mycofactocin system transcriptional regulator